MNALYRSRLLRALAGLAIVLILVAHDLGGNRLTMLAVIDRQYYDGRQALVTVKPDPRIVIVDIDERSLAERGRWPWPRERMADLIDALIGHGRPTVLGIDTLFAEPQRAELHVVAPTGGDAVLAQALRERPIVLGYYLSSDRDGRRSGRLPPAVFDDAEATGLDALMIHADGFAANLPELAEAADQGFFNAFVGAGIDVDGRIRSLPLLAVHHSSVYESFVVAVLRRALGSAAVIAQPRRLALTGPKGQVSIPVSVGYSAMVPYAGSGGRAGGRFQYVSASEVLDGTADWGQMHDRIVLIGTSSPGLTDLRPTPVSEVFPGVEIHASLIAGALDGNILMRPARAGELAAAASSLVGGVLALALPLVGPIGTALAGLVALLLLIGGEALAYWQLGLVLPIAGPLTAVLLLTVFNLLFGYLAEGRARRAVVKLFGEYLSRPLVEQMVRDPVSWRVAASVDRELTVLFADIRGFTYMAESMTPDALREYLNTVLTVMTEAIHRHGGTVDKYIGDAVMAFWGAPLDDAEHADHAMDAALTIQEEVRRLSAEFEQRGWPALAVGIGINTGIARVGDMGSALRRTYTAIGDVVNLASRIEGLTKRFVLPIIVGETTRHRCKRHEFDQLTRLLVEGRAEPVRVFVPRTISRMGQWGAPYNAPPGHGRHKGSTTFSLPGRSSALQSAAPRGGASDEGQGSRV